VDSRSFDCFINSTFIQTQHLPIYGIPPVKLRLIDGTSNSVISVTSGVLGNSQVLLNHRGDRWSVVHSLISCCAKGGPRRWLQLVHCTYLWAGVWVFWGLRAEASGLMPKDVRWGHGRVWGVMPQVSGFGVQGLGRAPEGSMEHRVFWQWISTQSWFTRCLTTRTEGPYILEL